MKAGIGKNCDAWKNKMEKELKKIKYLDIIIVDTNVQQSCF